MKDFGRRLRFRGSGPRLASIPARGTPGWKFSSSDEAKEKAAVRVAENLARIDELQYRLYAEGRQSLLIVVQGMDTSGKDGVIRKVMAAFNPQGCHVWGFKVPSAEEAAHDFLWRIHRATPGRGEIAIFNRSHYEDVLVVRVHDLVPREVWTRRYDQINAFERHLTENSTRVLKFYLHISPEEQLERLRARLDEPGKHWKFSEGDVAERARWKDYQAAYQDALARCSPAYAPWYVIPADRKWYRDLAVSEIVADTLAAMKPKLPKVELDVKQLRSMLEHPVAVGKAAARRGTRGGRAPDAV